MGFENLSKKPLEISLFGIKYQLTNAFGKTLDVYENKIAFYFAKPTVSDQAELYFDKSIRLEEKFIPINRITGIEYRPACESDGYIKIKFSDDNSPDFVKRTNQIEITFLPNLNEKAYSITEYISEKIGV